MTAAVEFHRRLYRSEGVILVRHWGPKQRQEPVIEQPMHNAAILLDYLLGHSKAHLLDLV
jgi:hypothetical protein